jgi:hypothetical protein
MLIVGTFQPNIALVDFDPRTKDLPYAHFDAERFADSNQRVIDFRQQIMSRLAAKEYATARRLLAQILHTIHDFYSHSNWIELGNTNSINSAIGTVNFLTANPVVAQTDSNLCDNSCELVTTQCGIFFPLLSSLITALGIANASPTFTCPIMYYKCANNILVNDKLLSGYYTGQKLSDGTEINKPDASLMKCSHGGILDKDSLKPAEGGINKDSAYYLFSPRANLHAQAAQLAIKHTEYFLDQIRTDLNDDAEFELFLKLEISVINNQIFETLNEYIRVCSSASTTNLNELKFLLWIFLIILIKFIRIQSKNT